MRKAMKFWLVIFVLFGLTMLIFGISAAQENTKIPAAAKPTLIMDTYKGVTVTVSGKIDYPGYKAGERIVISVRSHPVSQPPAGRSDMLPDIALMTISHPGNYSLKVPQNIGDIYMTARVIPIGENIPNKNAPKAKYSGGLPIKVGTKDISGIDMVLQ